MKNAHNEYQVNQIETSDPRQLVIMLYDGAIRFLDKAAAGITDFRKYDQVNQNLLKAQDILTELMLSLDMEKGGEIAANLLNLYSFMKKELLEANIKKDRSNVERVIKMLRDLKDAWIQMPVGAIDTKPAIAAERRTGFVAQG